jgi:16S rRNA (cytidine1402-2'-O)-methyltransferase
MACLYLVSTPIGNLEDISLRALAILQKVEVLLCEDTRKTGQLLAHYRLGGKPRLVSFYDPVEEKKIPLILSWLREGKNVALVTNSGTPLLSDPGFKLVRECIKEKIRVIPLPGATALLAGLVISGLPMDKFIFFGFLPKKQGKRRKFVEKIRDIQLIEQITAVVYESPFRLIGLLKLLAELFPQAEVVVARELTKKFEEVLRGKAQDLINLLASKKIKGELVVMWH